MRFIDRLPREAENKKFNVITPPGGLSDMVMAYLAGESDTLDLDIMRDFVKARLRVEPDPNHVDAINEARVYRIEAAFGVFLDADGQETDCKVELYGFITTEVTTSGAVAGVFTLRSLPRIVDFEAS